jgi:hypothetical protein
MGSHLGVAGKRLVGLLRLLPGEVRRSGPICCRDCLALRQSMQKALVLSVIERGASG